jgi:hypothetical protein
VPRQHGPQIISKVQVLADFTRTGFKDAHVVRVRFIVFLAEIPPSRTALFPLALVTRRHHRRIELISSLYVANFYQDVDDRFGTNSRDSGVANMMDGNELLAEYLIQNILLF